MERKDFGNISKLGRKTEYTFKYSPQLLERFPNRFPDRFYWVSFNCPEFTTLCPITGQPDFATIYIQYIPDRWLVESKSLKLYLFSFRDARDFHEDVVNRIADDLFNLLEPFYLEVYGEFNPRGGISIDPFVQRFRSELDWVKELASERFKLHRITPPPIRRNRG
ncbi:preQ(1) synthase [Thermovibrio ammonificans]|uniref:NADPH-dependent 7-cyano-7-deazaguanine reductase n=1 Tax=Thermovibrio ammonificans (strain DSM 15698 / JCM 12110 / HB-1) TaxID=648996 RepID=E8T4D4_THEA1|nr:preQ(1) synthase [Thermovibrio ammonificans]ADU96269.1 7-cyano-7-deazaguanine reductase [Thermovibrio ammonificans HB-1]